jgi:hypothetical protein
MLVPTTQHLCRDSTSPARQRLAQHRGHRAMEQTIVVVVPEAVKRADPRLMEAVVRVMEACAVLRGGARFDSSLLPKEPAQLVHVIEPQRCRQHLMRGAF